MKYFYWENEISNISGHSKRYPDRYIFHIPGERKQKTQKVIHHRSNIQINIGNRKVIIGYAIKYDWYNIVL